MLKINLELDHTCKSREVYTYIVRTQLDMTAFRRQVHIAVKSAAIPEIQREKSLQNKIGTFLKLYMNNNLIDYIKPDLLI